MGMYLIKTKRKEKKTYLVDLIEDKKIGEIYSDFNLENCKKKLEHEEIVYNKKRIGIVDIYQNDSLVGVRQKKGIFQKTRCLARLNKNGEYFIDENKVDYNIVPASVLLPLDEYSPLENSGLLLGYFLKGSEISKVLCFEKSGEMAGIIYSKDNDSLIALKGLPLVLGRTIDEQEFLFKFMMKG